MRRVKVFSGNSHPQLTAAICERLGGTPAQCELTKFSNGETSVSIGTSIRDQDVFIVQSGSQKTNDSIIELLIMISACKGGSARSITAVMPYFPYSRQSKKKSHRGAITARVLANLLTVAGIHHVITVDLHAPPMRGFFSKPIDNLQSEPLIARWIRHNVPEWHDAVVVSKNAGGSKRVTSLADTLKLNFGIITTDRRRSPMGGSMMLDTSTIFGSGGHDGANDGSQDLQDGQTSGDSSRKDSVVEAGGSSQQQQRPTRSPFQAPSTGNVTSHPRRNINTPQGASPLQRSTRIGSDSPGGSVTRLQRSNTAPEPLRDLDEDDPTEEYTDERAQDVITGRLIHGHIVDDDFPSPMLSTMSGSIANLQGDQIGPSQYEERDSMTASFMSTASSVNADHPLGGTYDAAALSEEEDPKDPEIEHTVTLVGNVNEKTVFIIDDIMDRSDSWIAAAETVVKRGGATKVYCIATHALFGEDCLQRLEECDCIDHVVVCNTFPIDAARAKASQKLVVLDLSGLLAEAIRRNHHGESISQLYQQYLD